MVLIFLSYIFASVSYVSWLSWITDLVPEGIRGRFFGTRNMLNGVAGIFFLIIFGEILDVLHDRAWGPLNIGFGITFTFAVIFGLVSLVFVNRISEPEELDGAGGQPLANRHVLQPFHEVNFRKFVTFAFFWNFSVYFASPFFTLYLLRDLRFS
ncbi:MAG: hypothetical protein JW736_02955 [Deltaproteobacteria bacterium]|nr:hypothetical protein [Deltaproteobacteria bacterium]